MRILKCQSNVYKFSSKTNQLEIKKILFIKKKTYFSRTHSMSTFKLFNNFKQRLNYYTFYEKGNKFQNFSYRNFCTNFKKENQLSEKIDILSKHQFQIPERYKAMTHNLKKIYMYCDLPYYYQFQQLIQKMIYLRNSDYNITLGKGDYFFMKNILLLINEYSSLQANKDSKIQNVIICENIKQLNFLEKIQMEFFSSINAVIKDYNLFLELNKYASLIPLNIIIYKNDFIDFFKNYPTEDIFSNKCLFIHYRINLDDKGINSLIIKN